MKFRIYYGDGSTFEGSSFEDAVNAPTLNVQVIVNEEPWRTDGNHGIQHGKDSYCFRDGAWFGMDAMGREHYLAESGYPKYTIYGRTTLRNEEFHECLRRALKEGLGD